VPEYIYIFLSSQPLHCEKEWAHTSLQAKRDTARRLHDVPGLLNELTPVVSSTEETFITTIVYISTIHCLTLVLAAI